MNKNETDFENAVKNIKNVCENAERMAKMADAINEQKLLIKALEIICKNSENIELLLKESAGKSKISIKESENIRNLLSLGRKQKESGFEFLKH